MDRVQWIEQEPVVAVVGSMAGAIGIDGLSQKPGLGEISEIDWARATGFGGGQIHRCRFSIWMKSQIAYYPSNRQKESVGKM